MEIIVIDDASTDKTLEKVYEFINNSKKLNIKVIKQNPWKGKASALNKALEITSNNIIIVTDSDVLLPKDTLNKTLLYLSDPTIGAITGHGVAKSNNDNWVVKAEKNYLNLIF